MAYCHIVIRCILHAADDKQRCDTAPFAHNWRSIRHQSSQLCNDIYPKFGEPLP
jgi:hypothetical protein